MNLIALTPCCVDYYPQRDKWYAGGNSLNAAAMWKKIIPEAHISVITCLGNDKNGAMVLDFLKNRQIDISRVYTRVGTTATNKISVDETGERYGIPGAWQGGVYETFLLADDDWQWVAQQDIVAMPGNNPNFLTMIKKKHKNQLLTVDYLDIENNITMAETVDYTDLAFIAARADLLPFYKDMAFSRNKMIVVTLGAGGSYAFYQRKTFFQPALPVPQVIDTTGCGDAYQAAFALSWHQTQNIEKAMFAGALAGAEIVQAWGGAAYPINEQ